MRFRDRKAFKLKDYFNGNKDKNDLKIGMHWVHKIVEIRF